jgi:hypothetical protein
MTKIVKHEQDSQQKLIGKYEELRALILRKNESPLKNSLGYSILLLRGMAVWIETCLACEETNADDKKLFSSRQVRSTTSSDTWKPNDLVEPFQAEATRILTNMVMQHQEMRLYNV